MADARIPFRLRVLMALTECLQEITPANGFEFDMSDEVIVDGDETGSRTRVVRGRDVFGDDEPLPLIAILEAPNPLDQKNTQHNNTTTVGPWDILIQGFVPDDKNHPLDPAHRLMGEVKTVLAKQKERRKSMSRVADYLGLGDRKTNSITGFSIGPGSVNPPNEISAKAFFYLVLSLEITENTAKPYD